MPVAARIIATLTATAALSMPAAAVTIDWVTVGDPGNPPDVWTHAGLRGSNYAIGDVAYYYSIARTEVTNAQYTELLNAKAASDPHALYNPSMGTNGGITRSGSPGSYTYAAIAGLEDEPVTYVSWYDALRFANWLHNGQGAGDTETGAYTITPAGIANNTIVRNPGAGIFVTSEDEWVKAGHYDAATMTYFTYATGSNTHPTCTAPTAAPSSANCDSVVLSPTDAGSYPGSPSPYGTLDQDGNVWEWMGDFVNLDGIADYFAQGGSYFDNDPFQLGIPGGLPMVPTWEFSDVGFRVSMPEPGLGSALAIGVLGLASVRPRRERTECARPLR